MNVTTLATSQPSRISPSAARVLIDIWITFQTVGGHFLTPILIATFLFSKAKRDSTLINLGLTFVLTSVFNCLLFYTNQYYGPEPNKRLCIVQAAAFTASAPMMSTAALFLIIQVRARIGMKPMKWLVLALIAPYIAFVIFFTWVSVLGSQHPESVTRARRAMYCSIDILTVKIVSLTFTGVFITLVLGYNAALCFRIYSLTRAVRRARRKDISVTPLALRLVVFMVYAFFAFITCFLSIHDDNTTVRDIYISTFGIAYFVVFGSQRDVFQAWLFWRKGTGAETRAETETETDTEEQHGAENDVALRSPNTKGVTVTTITHDDDDDGVVQTTLSGPPRCTHRKQGSVSVIVTQLRFEPSADENDPSTE